MSKTNLVNRYNKMKEKFTLEFTKILMKDINKLFKKYPKLEKFSWVQYTPYSNDGDECKFRVCCDTLTINGLTESNYYSKVESFNPYKVDWVLSEENKWMDEVSNEISEIIGNIPEEILQTVYGEGEVIVYKDGSIEVDDYEHE